MLAGSLAIGVAIVPLALIRGRPVTRSIGT
jgi:hypothetical protein